MSFERSKKLNCVKEGHFDTVGAYKVGVKWGILVLVIITDVWSKETDV